MKKLFYFSAILFAAFFVACSEEYDDSALTNRVDNLENRVERLEELCAQMNTNISSLQTIVNALQQKDYITAVAPINKNGAEVGYTITFSSGKSITIYHGNDGKDGSDGTDGKTPIIGVKQASDGVYYWTVDGEWLLDEDGNKIKAQSADSENGEDGEDGADGADGKDGITPQLKIEADYWYVSYDEGKTWTKLGKATGEDGADGSNGSSGDTFFQDVTEDDKCVYFTLADGTVLTVAKYVELQLFFDVSALKNVKVNSEVKVDYTVTGSAQKVEIEVMPSNDLRAEAVADDATKKSGHILIRTGSSFDSASKVVVLVSDGDKVVMKSISLQVVEDDDDNDDDDGTILGTPAKNEIFYTSTNGKVVEPYSTSAFDAAIVSNTYANGVGVIVFDREITTIGSNAFSNCDYLKSILLPNSVTTIGYCAFYACTRLTNITIPNSVTTIGVNALAYCISLTTITIPNSVTEIGSHAFAGCRLTNITIPDSVTTIGRNAFFDCSNLTTITIPDSVTEIGDSAFFDCKYLTKAVIGSGVKKIGYSAFENCYFLNEIICKPTTPPTAILDSGKWNAFKTIGTSAKIYVPVGSGAAYKAADYWSDYASIIEEKAM